MHDIGRHACTIGAADLALRLGEDKFRHYLDAFGLTERCEAGFGSETAPLSLRELQPIRIANMGFGQGIAVTPMHMAGAYATIANHGVRVHPVVIREIRNADGTVRRPNPPDPDDQVVSRDAADELVKILTASAQASVPEGIQTDSHTFAGMSGSAQISGRSGYEPGARIVSFIGFTPVTQARYVIAVVVNRPQLSQSGAKVAAPVFYEIATKTLDRATAKASRHPGR